MNAPHRPDKVNSVGFHDPAERSVLLCLVRILALLLMSSACLSLNTAGATDVPQVKADIGPCSAEFTVTDKNSKPIYDAKIHVVVRYGFMDKKKQDLEIGTNSDGKALIAGLPIKVKRPLEYQVRFGELTKSVMSDPGIDCHATNAVTLGAP